MIRIDAMWLAADPIDMRAGADRLLARVVQVFGAAQAHHGYLFANARGTCIKFSCTTALASGARPECVNDFATPCFINLRCRFGLFQWSSFGLAVG